MPPLALHCTHCRIVVSCVCGVVWRGVVCLAAVSCGSAVVRPRHVRGVLAYRGVIAASLPSCRSTVASSRGLLYQPCA